MTVTTYTQTFEHSEMAPFFTCHRGSRGCRGCELRDWVNCIFAVICVFTLAYGLVTASPELAVPFVLVALRWWHGLRGARCRTWTWSLHGAVLLFGALQCFVLLPVTWGGTLNTVSSGLVMLVVAVGGLWLADSLNRGALAGEGLPPVRYAF